MLDPVSVRPTDQPLDIVEADVLPALSALLGSVTDRVKSGTADGFASRSDELRDMSRQIIELTQFLAAFTGGSGSQPSEARIRA